MTRYAETRFWRLVVRLLLGGLVISTSLVVVFYLLSVSIHPPAALKPGSTLQITDWINAYTNWHNTYLTYSEAYGLSLVAVSGFLVAFGILLAPRLAFFLSFALLNVYFAWTSHLLYDISRQTDIWLGHAIASQASFFWTTEWLGYFFPSFVFVTDLDVLVLLGVLVASTLLLNYRKGAKRAILLSLQLAALSLTILGAEIAIFDPREFNLHVTQAQSVVDFFPSFTNADLLLFALAIFATSTCLLNLRRLRPQRY